MKTFLNTPEIETIKHVLHKSDGIIAFPTDTVWGMGCLVENFQAVDRIYEIKGRDRSKPLILLGSKIDYLIPYLKYIPDKAWDLINKHLPGAVTLVLPKNENVSDYITSGFDTVGIRIPDFPPFIELLEKVVDSHVLATTSANLSGSGATAFKKDVENILGDDVDYILDNYGIASKGMESTVISVDVSGNVNMLRQGSIIVWSIYT
jgi:L-threonylcarbamoyladenylate synthase